ncbi:MAG TPA: diguanylate cyclase [Miltoncostaeaceae bacterium]|nr:diguanylate cyclase [Miltoncostaeaceae bacterium]
MGAQGHAIVPPGGTFPRPSRAQRALAALAVAALAAVTALVASGAGPPGLRDALADGGTIAVSVLALAVLALRLRHPAPDRPAWAVLAVGLAGWVVADVAWAVTGRPELSWADAGWLAFYPLAYVGLALMVRATVARVPLLVWLDGLIGVLVVGAVGAAVLLPALDPVGGRTGVDLIVNVTYPVADLALVGVVAVALALAAWRPTRMWTMLAAGFGLMGAGDALYLLAVARDLVVPDWVLAAAWTGAFTLICLAALCPPRPVPPAATGSLRLLLAPGAFALVAGLLLVREGLHEGRSIGSALAGATLVVICGRLVLHAHEVRRADAALRAARDLAERDGLTDLLNHGAFHDALRRECARAERHGTALSLVLLDLDHFKQVNDCHGHLAGDEVLRGVARLMRGEARAGDVLGRTGGEELAWLLPGTDLAAARAAADRLRRAVARGGLTATGITASLGVAGRSPGEGAEGLFARTDTALYWAKEAGRDRVVAYSPDARELRLEGQRALPLRATISGRMVRALALTLHAADPPLARHCERVADAAVGIASVLGWEPHRLVALHEAAAVHDLGRLGAPGDGDAAALSGIVVAEVLSEEQGGWVREHLHHWDASPPPGAGTSEGARILAVADAWDVLRAEDGDGAAALAVLEALAGRRFWPPAVEALGMLHRAEAARPALAAGAV